MPAFHRENPFDIVASLAGRVLGGVSKDGGGIIIRPGGGGGPVPPWDPLRPVLSVRTRREAVVLAIQAAIDLTDDEALRRALNDMLEKARRGGE